MKCHVLLIASILSFITACQTVQQNDNEAPQVNLRCNNCITTEIPSSNKSSINNRSLLVISPDNDEPQWYILAEGYTTKISNTPDTFHRIHQITASKNGKYLAIISSGEGHPLLTIVDLKKLINNIKSKPLLEIDPYPGVISIFDWENGHLILSSDILLTHRIDDYDRVPGELMLFSGKKFSLNIESNQIEAISEEIKNPVEYYGKHLTISPDEYSPQAELQAIKKLNSAEAIPYLKAALKMERYLKHRDSIRLFIDSLKKITDNRI